MAEDTRLAEFRDRNTALMRDNDALRKENDELKKRYEGIDPDAARANAVKVADYEKAKPTERIAALETELAAERAAHVATRKEADTALIDSQVSDAFLKAGGRPEARGFIVQQAAGQFVVEKGQLVGTKHAPDRPGEKLSLTDFITLQMKANGFCFYSSSGGGANPSRGNPGGSGKVLRNPDPFALGRHAKEIASGELKVIYD